MFTSSHTRNQTLYLPVNSAPNPDMDNVESVMERNYEGSAGTCRSGVSRSSDTSTSTTESNNSRRGGKVGSKQTACVRSNKIKQPPTERLKKSRDLIRKRKNTSSQTGTFEEMYNAQLTIHKTTLQGCRQIRNIIDKNMSPPFVGLYKICFELEQAISEPRNLPSESIQNDLMKGFLRLAYCWVNLYSYFGMSQCKFNNLDTTCADVTQLFQNWTYVSQKLMKVLIKIFGCETDTDSLRNTMDREEKYKTETDSNQNTGFKTQCFTSHNKHPCDVTQGGCSNTFTPFLKDMHSTNTLDKNKSLALYAPDPQDMTSVHHTASVYEVGSPNTHYVYVQNNSVNMTVNHTPNCRNRRFPGIKPENMRPQNQIGVDDGKISLQYPKCNNRRRINASSANAPFHSTCPNTECSEITCVNTRRQDKYRGPSTKTSQNDSHASQGRFSGLQIHNGFKQKTYVSGTMSSPALLSRQYHLSNRAADILESSKHWQQQPVQATEIKQESPDHKLHVEDISTNEVTSVLKSKTTSLGQADTCSKTHGLSHVSDAEEKFTGKEEETFSSIYTTSPTSNKPEGSCSTEKYKYSKTTIKPYQQTSAASKNVPVKKNQNGKKEEEQFIPRFRKPVSGILGKKAHSQHQYLGRSNSDSRNRKLQEPSATEEHKVMQTTNQGFMKAHAQSLTRQQDQANLANNRTKPKSAIHNKTTWNILYSSRHRLGLTPVTVNTLEHILNVIWNMEASDFIKYPVSSSELEDYYKCMKYPVCLETIGYKLRNRIYETIEQFVHDFRRVILNAKLYNKDSPVYLQLTDILEKKFSHLLEDHFYCWDFENTNGEQNETKYTPGIQYTAFRKTNTSFTNRRAKLFGN